jgi:voltage-gated potassium channel Kch
MKLVQHLYPRRFELLLLSQLAILFGSLLMPGEWFEDWVSPMILILNLFAGVVLVYEKKRLMRFLFVLVVINILIFILDTMGVAWVRQISVVKLFVYFVFYGLVTYEIILQVAHARSVTKNVIIGLISGYLALGLLSFFLFMAIEFFEPNSYSTIVFGDNSSEKATEQLLYFSFVTLLTIGYGEIVPISELAQKAAILVALIGQFYLVILTAIVVGKFINQMQVDRDVH